MHGLFARTGAADAERERGAGVLWTATDRDLYYFTWRPHTDRIVLPSRAGADRDYSARRASFAVACRGGEAAGKTPRQLGGQLTRAYSKYLNNAQVTVTLSEIAGLDVYVGGEVGKPSMLPIPGELTLSQSIAEAGGFLRGANTEQVLIIRRTGNGHYHTLQANVEKVLSNEAAEVYLRPHDIVYVPKTKIALADKFVEEYINEIVPHAVGAGLGFGYSLGGVFPTATAVGVTAPTSK
jgi:hypothetical protein